MNERAREALVAAALKGVPQIKGDYRDREGGPGRCAMGVLFEAAGISFTHQHAAPGSYKILEQMYDFRHNDEAGIVTANDNFDWDFLTIARKVGTDDDV